MNNFGDEEFGSDSEDNDYCPTDDSISDYESDGDHGDCEDAGAVGGGGGGKPGKGNKKKSKKQTETSRKRKGGISLQEDTMSTENSAIAPSENTPTPAPTPEAYVVPDFKEEIRLQAEEKKEEATKNRTDDLWSSFLKDTKTVAKKKVTSITEVRKSTETNGRSQPKPGTSDKKPVTDFFGDSPSTSVSKVKKIEVEYDFAGESIKVMKEVSVNSKEASAHSNTAKRSGGLSSLLNKIAKKPKMGTLIKSQIDWNSYKQKEGFVEEMATHNKGKNGYIERKNFLERTDHRQFEKEKEARVTSRKR